MSVKHCNGLAMFRHLLQCCHKLWSVDKRERGEVRWRKADIFARLDLRELITPDNASYQARARSTRARRACRLRALGLLLADGTPTVGGGKTF